MKLQEQNKLIPDKKSVMTIIFNQCNKATRAEIVLGSSYEDNSEAGELIKFLVRVCTACNETNDAKVLFSSMVTKLLNLTFNQHQLSKNYHQHIRAMMLFGIILIHATYLLIPQMTQKLQPVFMSRKNQPSQQQYPCQMMMTRYGLMYVQNLIHGIIPQKPWTTNSFACPK